MFWKARICLITSTVYSILNERHNVMRHDQGHDPDFEATTVDSHTFLASDWYARWLRGTCRIGSAASRAAHVNESHNREVVLENVCGVYFDEKGEN
jgi:hypothetical protein